MKKVYIAGPMRGYKDFNMAAFLAAEERLQNDFDFVFNPVKLDKERGLQLEGTNGTVEELEGFTQEDLAYIIREDVEHILNSTHIYMLKGWEKSKGATAEKAVAEWYDIEIMYEE